ncbi:E3 ubiquitin-protein ligase TRIM71-like [Ruditapes philippinarum]|uniref:E3 ubiquitin-protein ligase TRIM71-like n=1 Tax=Ruditapes philippinarum TaxID=129788 RepID=UPI00295C1000|nr:E3 ubiquitin-protein ligase TRIM71-like [Ruditapes philippinarum]
MATEGCTPRSSDELFDFSCTPCNKKDKNSEAVKYCVDCQEYLCENCVDNHNSFSVLAGHTLVGQSKFGQSGSGSKDLPSVPTERCKLHSLKLVDMYCADHDAVGCHVCFTITHRLCQDIHYIPEYIQTNNLTDDGSRIEAELERAINEIGFVLEKKQQEIENNKKARETHLEDIKQYRKKLNEILDKLEQASITELDVTFRKLDEDYRKSVTQMQECIEKLASRKADIVTSQNNQSQTFVNVKMSRCLLSDSVKDITLLPNQGRLRLTLERNLEISHFLKKLDMLAKCATMKHELYKISNRTTVNVKMIDDELECSIWSSCVLDKGNILITDLSNTNLKLVDSGNFKVKDSLEMSGSPSSVCKISNSEAAVSLSIIKTVQFVATENHLTKTRSLKFDHECRGLAVIDGRLVIGNDNDQVYIYTMNRQCLKVIKTEKTGNKMFGRVRELCVSDDGKMIHIVDAHRGVITIDRDGTVLWKYNGQELKSPWGICTDGTGNVIVSGFSSHNVVQLSPDGKLLGKIISDEYKLKNPRAVCFDRKKCKLIAAVGNELHCFQVK